MCGCISEFTNIIPVACYTRGLFSSLFGEFSLNFHSTLLRLFCAIILFRIGLIWGLLALGARDPGGMVDCFFFFLRPILASN